MKICRDCKEETENHLLVKSKIFADGYDTLCKACNKRRVKEWRQKNPKLRQEQQKREGKKDYSRSKHYRRMYGITVDDYNKMFAYQEGCCDICGKHQAEFNKRFSVDHNHTTGKIRGLLCSNCNFLLGYAKDDIEILSSAITYLQKTN